MINNNGYPGSDMYPNLKTPPLLNSSEIEFVIESLNETFNLASTIKNNIGNKLGDIELKNINYKISKSKEIMKKLGAF